MSIVEYVRYDVVDRDADAFVAAWHAVYPIISGCVDCLDVELRRGLEAPDEFVARVVWTSVDGHHAFRATPDFARFKSALAGYSIASIGRYDAVAIAGDGAASS